MVLYVAVMCVKMFSASISVILAHTEISTYREF